MSLFNGGRMRTTVRIKFCQLAGRYGTVRASNFLIKRPRVIQYTFCLVK